MVSNRREFMHVPSLNIKNDKPLVLGIGFSGLRIIKACIHEGIQANYFIVESNLRRARREWSGGVRGIYFSTSVSDLKKKTVDFSLMNILPHLSISFNKVIMVNGAHPEFDTLVARKQFNELSNFNIKFKWITSLPFKTEGKSKLALVNGLIQDIRHHQNLILIDSEETINKKNGYMSLIRMWQEVDNKFIMAINSVI